MQCFVRGLPERFAAMKDLFLAKLSYEIRSGSADLRQRPLCFNQPSPSPRSTTFSSYLYRHHLER